MIKIIIYLLFTFSLDNFITNNCISLYNNLSYLFPMLVISTIIIVYMLTNKQTCIIISLIVGFIYDMCYSQFPINIVLFFIISIIITRKNINNNLKNVLFYTVLSIIIYDSLLFILLIITNYSNLSIIDLIYKLYHSFIINIIYSSFSFLVFFGHKKSIIKKKNSRYSSYS